jgi:hypothetical protein
MSDYERFALVLEMVIQGLIPNAHPQALGKIDDVIHDLALDWEAFGIWFDNQIRKNNLSLQEIDLVGLVYQYIAYDFKRYMHEQYNETSPDLEVLSDEEDTKFTNWQEICRWIEDLETRNPQAAEDGFVKGLYAFPNE